VLFQFYFSFYFLVFFKEDYTMSLAIQNYYSNALGRLNNNTSNVSNTQKQLSKEKNVSARRLYDNNNIQAVFSYGIQSLNYLIQGPASYQRNSLQTIWNKLRLSFFFAWNGSEYINPTPPVGTPQYAYNSIWHNSFNQLRVIVLWDNQPQFNVAAGTQIIPTIGQILTNLDVNGEPNPVPGSNPIIYNPAAPLISAGKNIDNKSRFIFLRDKLITLGDPSPYFFTTTNIEMTTEDYIHTIGVEQFKKMMKDYYSNIDEQTAKGEVFGSNYHFNGTCHVVNPSIHATAEEVKEIILKNDPDYWLRKKKNTSDDIIDSSEELLQATSGSGSGKSNYKVTFNIDVKKELNRMGSQNYASTFLNNPGNVNSAITTTGQFLFLFYSGRGNYNAELVSEIWYQNYKPERRTNYYN